MGRGGRPTPSSPARSSLTSAAKTPTIGVRACGTTRGREDGVVWLFAVAREAHAAGGGADLG